MPGPCIPLMPPVVMFCMLCTLCCGPVEIDSLRFEVVTTGGKGRLLMSSMSPISGSCPPPIPVLMPTFDCRRWRLGVVLGGGRLGTLLLVGAVVGFGGAAAIGTTLPLVGAGIEVPWLVGVLPAVEPPFVEPCADCGDSESFTLWPWVEVGVVTGVCTIEFLREAFLEERADAVPTGIEFPLPRLRFLMTSVLRDNGRTTPCSFRNKPQALHKGWPSGLRRHNGVVWVKQLVQVVGMPLLSPFRDPPGLPGREGATLLNPDSGGELGEDCGL